MRYFLIIIALFFNLVFSKAETSNDLFLKANKAYEEKRFDEAVKNYEAILKNDEASANLFFNLGNAYLKSDQISKAILHYEKGLLLKPNHKAIKKNLSLVKENQKESIEALPGFFLNEAWNSFRNKTTTKNWSILFLLSLFLSIAAIILWMLGNSRKSKQLGFSSALILIFFSLIFFLFALQSHQRKFNKKEAIVLTKENELRKAPDALSESILILPEGCKLFIKDQIKTEKHWFKVRIQNGETGWVLNENLGFVSLP